MVLQSIHCDTGDVEDRHVPALTFVNEVTCIPAAAREWLGRRECEVGRLAMGCHGAVAVEAIQGDLGWSGFEVREAASKIAYLGRLRHMPRSCWGSRVFCVHRPHLYATPVG